MVQGRSLLTSTEALADRLSGAYSGGLVEPIADELPEKTITAAYQIQLAQVGRWQAAGRRIAGRKIGLTSLAVQRQLGVDMPDFGHVMADMIHGDHSVLPFDRLQQPRVEAEIALVLERDLDFEHVTVADVLAATGWIVPALEVVSSRIADWKISIFDTIADNASAGLVALGGTARRPDGVDLTGCEMSMVVNGEQAATGHGSDCLGNPLNAAAWLARAARDLGSPLRAGEVILTGALGPMAPVRPGDVVEATISGIGSVRTTLSTDQEILSE